MYEAVFLWNVTGVVKKAYEGGKKNAVSMVLDYLRDSREEEKNIQSEQFEEKMAVARGMVKAISEVKN